MNYSLILKATLNLMIYNCYTTLKFSLGEEFICDGKVGVGLAVQHEYWSSITQNASIQL